MTKLNLKLKYEIQNVEMVITLIELLNHYKSELPEKLVAQLDEVADSDAFEYDNKYFIDKGIRTTLLSIHADGYKINNVISINRILRRIKIDRGPDVHFDYCVVMYSGRPILTIGENNEQTNA